MKTVHDYLYAAVVAEANARYERFRAWEKEHPGSLEYSQERHLFSSYVLELWPQLLQLLRAGSECQSVIVAACRVHAARKANELGEEPGREALAVAQLIDAVDTLLGSG